MTSAVTAPPFPTLHVGNLCLVERTSDIACHGLDVHDNDFLIGLVGKELQPLSHIVQAMRKTAQTSEYMASLGPFFVGHVIWQSPSR